MQGREVREVMEVQRAADDEMASNARRQLANPRAQRGQALRGQSRDSAGRGVNIRQNRLSVQFNAMQLDSMVPGDGLTPA